MEIQEEESHKNHSRQFHYILSKRIVYGKKQYLVKWIGSDELTWEPETNQYISSYILDYERTLEGKLQYYPVCFSEKSKIQIRKKQGKLVFLYEDKIIDDVSKIQQQQVRKLVLKELEQTFYLKNNKNAIDLVE